MKILCCLLCVVSLSVVAEEKEKLPEVNFPRVKVVFVGELPVCQLHHFLHKDMCVVKNKDGTVRELVTTDATYFVQDIGVSPPPYKR